MNARRKSPENIDFETFVDIYNSKGKQEAAKFVMENYNIRYDSVVKRLRKESDYIYNHKRDRYILKSDQDSTFMTVEELCSIGKSHINENISFNTDELILSLIKDNFFEISKYVKLEQSSKKLVLKLDAAKNAGYEIVYI